MAASPTIVQKLRAAEAAAEPPPPNYRLPLLRFDPPVVAPDEAGLDRRALAAAGGLLLLAAIGGAFVTALARRELGGRPA